MSVADWTTDAEIVALLDAVGTGTHTFTLDGTGLPSGVYLVRVVGEPFTESARVTLVDRQVGKGMAPPPIGGTYIPSRTS